MKVRFFDIKWDTDGEEVDLPSECVLEVDDDADLDEQGADCLSDEYGFCVESVSYEIQPAEANEDDLTCAQCGRPYFVDDADCTHHIVGDSGFGIDYDADADHTAYGDEDESEA